MKFKSNFIILIVIPIFFLFSFTLPYKIQSILILRILSYDKNIDNRTSNGVINIGILYNPADSASKSELTLIKKEMKSLQNKKLKIKNYSFNLETIPVAIDSDLIALLRTKKIKVLYITKGNKDSMKTIIRVTRKLKIFSITSDDAESNVKKGISVGLGLESNKPKIFVNIKASIKEGSDFSAQFLSLAEIIK